MPYFTEGAIGFDPSINTTGTSTAGAGAPDTLGVTRAANDGNTYMFVQASAAITQYSTVWVTTAFQASMVTDTTIGTNPGGRVGFAQTAFAQYEFGYVVVHGNAIRIRFADACAKAVPLYTTATAGVLDDATASASQFQVMGVVIETVSGNTPSNALASCSFPQLRRPVT
jgi:hypothetical protein